MRYLLTVVFFALSLHAKIIGSDFLTLEKESLKITDEPKFISYVKSLDDGRLIAEYKNISKPVNLLQGAEERLIAVDSYEQAFKNLKFIDSKLYLKEKPENIDSQISSLKSSQGKIVALLFSVKDKNYYDVDVIPIIFEYMKLDRKVLELQIQKESLTKSKEAIIDAIVKKNLRFENEDPLFSSRALELAKRALATSLEASKEPSFEKKEALEIKAAHIAVLSKTYEIKADFFEKIKLLKKLKSSKSTEEERGKLSKLLSKKYECLFFEAQSVKGSNVQSFLEYKKDKETFLTLCEETKLESLSMKRVLESFDDTIGAKAGGFFEAVYEFFGKILKTTLFVSNNIDVNIKSVALSIFGAILIFMLKRWVVKSAIPAYFEKSEAGAERSAHIRFIVSKAAGVAAYALIFFVILGGFGLSLTNFAIIVSALSVGIGFGLQGVVSNFISGVILLFENSVKIGDLLRLSDGRVGRVTSVNLRTTNVKTFDNIDILIPNSMVFSGQIENMTRESSVVRRDIKFTVGYNTDTIRLKEILDVKTKEMLGGDLIEESALLIFGYTNNGIGVEYRVMVDLKKKPLEIGDFLREFVTELIKNGVELPYNKLEIIKIDGGCS